MLYILCPFPFHLTNKFSKARRPTCCYRCSTIPLTSFQSLLYSQVVFSSVWYQQYSGAVLPPSVMVLFNFLWTVPSLHLWSFASSIWKQPIVCFFSILSTVLWYLKELKLMKDPSALGKSYISVILHKEALSSSQNHCIFSTCPFHNILLTGDMYFTIWLFTFNPPAEHLGFSLLSTPSRWLRFQSCVLAW